MQSDGVSGQKITKRRQARRLLLCWPHRSLAKVKERTEISKVGCGELGQMLRVITYQGGGILAKLA